MHACLWKLLQFEHSIHISLRDIKGANLLVHTDGRILLTDFGISVKLEGEGEKVLLGTPYWLAPEVVLSTVLFKPYGTYVYMHGHAHTEYEYRL